MKIDHCLQLYVVLYPHPVQNHNQDPTKEAIRSVLCPGLGTAVGKMPYDRCAYQVGCPNS